MDEPINQQAACLPPTPSPPPHPRFKQANMLAEGRAVWSGEVRSGVVLPRGVEAALEQRRLGHMTVCSPWSELPVQSGTVAPRCHVMKALFGQSITCKIIAAVLPDAADICKGSERFLDVFDPQPGDLQATNSS